MFLRKYAGLTQRVAVTASLVQAQAQPKPVDGLGGAARGETTVQGAGARLKAPMGGSVRLGSAARSASTAEGLGGLAGLAQTMRELPGRYAEMRRSGAHFEALRLLDSAKGEREGILKLPAAGYKAAWGGLLELVQDADAKAQMSGWMRELAADRIKKVTYGVLWDADKTQALCEALNIAGRTQELTQDADQAPDTAENYWSGLEASVRRGLSYLGWPEKLSPDALAPVVTEKVRVVTEPFAAAGRPSAGIVEAVVKSVAQNLRDQGYAALPWLMPLAQEHGVAQSFVLREVMDASRYSDDSFLNVSVARLSAEQTSEFMNLLGDILVKDASYVDYRTITGKDPQEDWTVHPVKNYTPLNKLFALPELLKRISLSEADRAALAESLERAGEQLVRGLSREWDAADRDQVTQHHAAWCFVHRLHRRIETLDQVGQILAGLRNQPRDKTRAWQPLFEQQGEIYAAIAAAARSAGMSDAMVKRSWREAQAEEAARLEKARVESEARLDAAKKALKQAVDHDATTTARLRLVGEAAVNWPVGILRATE